MVRIVARWVQVTNLCFRAELVNLVDLLELILVGSPFVVCITLSDAFECVCVQVVHRVANAEGLRARERRQTRTFGSKHPNVAPPPSTRAGSRLRADLESPQNSDFTRFLKRLLACVFWTLKIDHLPHFWTIL